MRELSLSDKFWVWAHETFQKLPFRPSTIFLLVALLGFVILVTFNKAGSSYASVTGVVEKIRSKSTTIESGAGGFNQVTASVRLFNGKLVTTSITYPPIPKIGDTIKLTKHEHAISGGSYQYAGKIKKPT